MAPPIIKFTTEEEEKLVAFVQENPQLYDKGNKHYKDRTVRRGKWMHISGQFQNKSPDDCKRTWEALRGQFMNFLKRLENPSGTGSSSRPYFRHEQAMLFLKDKFENTETTLTNLSNLETGDEEFGIELQNIMEIQDETLSSLPEETETQNESASTADGSVLVPRSKPSSMSKKRKLDPFDQEMLSLLKQDEDECDLFLKSLAPKLRRIADKDKKTYLRLTKTIMNHITDAEIDILE